MINNKFKKIIKISLLLILIICSILIAYYNFFCQPQYFPLIKTMQAAGFLIKDENSFYCVRSGKEINISFDFENNICYKNQYTFQIDDYKNENGEYYIKREILENILNGTLRYNKGDIILKPYAYEKHDWLKYSKLIAHAGGVLNNDGKLIYYTNSLEALIQNYNSGHRIFEFDFYLTSDNKLAVVHDWINFGYYDGTYLSSEEWKNIKYDINGNYYTKMMLSDLLDEMLVNKDMFIVTDTKSFDFTDEQVKLQFQLIYDEAVKRDPEILDRIIPQIYNEEMYYIVKSVYDFESIIYTIYALYDSAQNIISFANEKDEIKVITVPYEDKRFNNANIKRLHRKGLLIFTHTINQESQLTQCIKRGIDGYYTDLILPSYLK